MKTAKWIIMLCVISLFTGSTFGQTTGTKSEKYNKFYIGLNGGAMVSFANIKEKDFFPVSGETKFGAGAVAGYQISPIFGVQGQFIYGNLSGQKSKWANGDPANLKFDANVIEYCMNATISLTNWWAPHAKLSQKINLYGLVGAGLVNFRSKLTTLDQGVIVHTDGYINNGQTKKEMTTEAVFPVGIGVKYKISDKWSVGIETNLRNVNTQKLDAYERLYIAKDKYSYTFIGVQYSIGKHKKSSEWQDMNEYAGINNTTDSTLLRRIDSLDRELAILKNRVNDSLIKAKNNAIENKVNGLESEIGNLSKRVDSLDLKDCSSAASLFPSIYFNTGKSKIQSIYYSRIASVALFLKSNPEAKLKVVGHTDKTGSEAVNQKLATQRAQAAIDMLVNEFGISNARLVIEPKASKEPLSNSNNTINRRVEFFILK